MYTLKNTSPLYESFSLLFTENKIIYYIENCLKDINMCTIIHLTDFTCLPCTFLTKIINVFKFVL